MTDDPNDRGVATGVVLLVGLVAVVGVLAAGTAALSASGDALPDGETVLNNSAGAYENATTVVGTANVTVENATASRTAAVEFAAADPNLTRVEWTGNGTTRVVGHDGNRSWLYLPENDTVYWFGGEENATAAGLAADATDDRHPGNWTWTDADWNYTAETEAVETVDGTESYRVALTPENDSVDANGTVWVATDDWRVVRAEYVSPNRTATVAVTRQQFNVSVHESTFSPPSNATPAYGSTTYDSVEAAQDATDLTLPELTAEGYAFENATVVTYGNRTVVASTYANDTVAAQVVTATGEASLPNGTNVTVDGREATATTRDGRTVVTWRATDPATGDPVTRAVVSPLSVDATVALTESVEVPAGAESDG